MKTLAILLTLGSLNAFAQDIYTHCETINLQKDYKAVNVDLSKNGELEKGNFEISATKGESYDKVEIDGLTAKLVSATLLDSTTKSHWGMVQTTTHTQVYGVKFHISANEAIGHEINGCIPQPINELDTYAICYQSYTVMNRR